MTGVSLLRLTRMFPPPPLPRPHNGFDYFAGGFFGADSSRPLVPYGAINFPEPSHTGYAGYDGQYAYMPYQSSPFTMDFTPYSTSPFDKVFYPWECSQLGKADNSLSEFDYSVRPSVAPSIE
jgi:hypothetical protein